MYHRPATGKKSNPTAHAPNSCRRTARVAGGSLPDATQPFRSFTTPYANIPNVKVRTNSTRSIVLSSVGRRRPPATAPRFFTRPSDRPRHGGRQVVRGCFRSTRGGG